MSINSIGSSNSAAMHGMQSMQRPDPAKMADDLFSKLDSKNQGYLEKADLETALNKIGNSGDSASSADEMFAKLDSDGDGKVTKQEMSATFEQIASELDGPFPRMRLNGQGDMPPPPPQDGEKADEGFTQEQLTAMSEDNDSTASKKTDLFSQLANNFDAADSNGDGKVTHDEAMAFEQANSSNSGSEDGDASNSRSANASDMQFMKKMMELMHAYGGDTNQTTSFSTSA